MKFEQIFANIVIQLFILLPIQMSLAIAAQPVVSNIVVVPVDNTRAMVNFTTDQTADTKVNFGIDQNLGMLTTCFIDKCLIADPNISHSIIISGLSADTSYNFKALSQNAAGEEGQSSIAETRTFKTNEITLVNLTGLKEEPIDAVTIKWETTAESDSILYYGNESGNLDRQLSDAALTKQHSITLSGLEKGKTYYYKVKSSYVESDTGSFLAPVDIKAPTVTYVKPSPARTNATLKIEGTIDENATIEIRSNTYLLAISEAGADRLKVRPGIFNATIQLRQGINRIELKATDDYDNSFIDKFNITVDSQAPVITLKESKNGSLVDFSQYAPFAEKNLTIKVDENAKITIKLNNNSVKSTTEFNDTLNQVLHITKDENILEVIAEDAAGNKEVKQETITRLKELSIEILQPNMSDSKTGAKYVSKNEYQLSVSEKFKLVLKTNPGAKVKLWRTYEKLDGSGNFTPDYEKTADGNGIVQMDIDMPALLTRSDYQKYENYYKNKGGATHEEASAKFSLGMELTYFLRIEAEDEYGRKTKDAVTIEAKREKCGSAEPWYVEVDRDDHEFKPYRLIDGHELLDFKIKLDWIGMGENPKVRAVVIKPQKITPDMLYGKNNESYACLTQGKIFPRMYKAKNSNTNRTSWYLMYKLEPWEGLNDTMVRKWDEAFKNLVNKKCAMPLKVEIEYEYFDTYNQSKIVEKQEYCFTQENIIQDQVDPRMVIPEWLLDGSLDVIDKALQALGPIEDGLRAVNEIARYSCYTTALNYVIKQITTKVKCLTAKKDKGNKEIWDAGDAKSCADSVQELKTMYNRYRFFCDRVWCKAAPADPKANPNPSTEIRGEAIKIQMQGAPTESGESCNNVKGYTCVRNENYRNYYCGTGNPTCYSTQDCMLPNEKTEKNPATMGCCCRKVNENVKQETQIIADETIIFNNNYWSNGVESKSYLIYGSTQWFVSDQNKLWNFGAWRGFGAETDEGLVSPVFIGKAGGIEANKRQKEVKDTLKGKSPDGYNYDTYVSGLYATSCFNQKPWFDKDRLYLTPSQNFLDSIQCGCVSDVYGRVQQWKNILQAMQNCLKQIKETGEADAGACKAMFTQYACDLLTWVAVKAAMIIKGTINAGPQEVKEDTVPMGDAIAESIAGALGSFYEDYGNEARITPDFSMESLMHAVCVFAFTHEWEPGFGGLFDMEQEGPPRQSAVFIAPARRELLGANPMTGKAYYEYGVGVSFTAGSKIKYYDIQLICDGEGDCPGIIKPKQFKSEPEIKTGRINNIGMNQFSSVQGVMYVDNEDFRYNKVKVCWISEAGKEYNGCEEAEINPTEDLTIFECDIKPGAAIGGNNLLYCGLMQTGTTAKFVRQPPARIPLTVTQSTLHLEIPFSIQTVYTTEEEKALPFILLIDEVTDSQGSKMMQSFGEYSLTQDGIVTQDMVTNMPKIEYGKVFGAGTATITISPEVKDDTLSSRICTNANAKITPGAIVIASTLYINVGGLDEKSISINAGGSQGGEPYGLTTQYGCSNIGYCCNGQKCKLDNTGTLTLNIDSAKVEMKVEKGARCLVKIDLTQGSTNQVTKYYKISINSNNGEGHAGPVVYAEDKPQEQVVEVVLTRGEVTQQQQQTGTQATPATIESAFKEFKLDTGQKTLQGIRIVPPYNYLSYSVEDTTTRLIQAPKEIPAEEFPTFKFDPTIPQGIYFLKIQAANRQAGQAVNVQSQQFTLNIGQGEKKLNKPTGLSTQIILQDGNQQVNVLWTTYKNPEIKYEVSLFLNGAFVPPIKVVGVEGVATFDIQKKSEIQEARFEVKAKIDGTDIVSEAAEIKIAIPAKSSSGFEGPK